MSNLQAGDGGDVAIPASPPKLAEQGCTFDLTGQTNDRRCSQVRPRTVVLIRAHFMSEKLLHLIRMLKEGVGYDLRVCADETEGPLDLPRELVLSHNTELCARLGLVESIHNAPLLWYFGDYALYCAHHYIPDYDYYIMIEYDVAFVRGNVYALESLISQLGDARHDLVATFFRRAVPDWVWSKTCGNWFRDVYGIFFPLVVLSKRALQYLYDWRKCEAANPSESGPYVFCEAFVPSALMAAGEYRCADLNQVLPGSWDHKSFRCEPAMLLGALPALGQGIEVAHPVYSEHEYLRSELRKARERDAVADFIARLSSPDFLPLSPEVRRAFLNELSETKA
jgi:hypothetical protein